MLPFTRALLGLLDFLDEGVRYHAAMYSDVPGRRRSRKSQKLVDAETTVSIVMEPCGGGLMILQPAP